MDPQFPIIFTISLSALGGFIGVLGEPLSTLINLFGALGSLTGSLGSLLLRFA